MELNKTIAYKFLKTTTLSYEKLGLRPFFISPAPPFKEYPDSPKIKLIIDEFPQTLNFFEILKNRRSERKYRKKEISLKEISLLCFAIQGITGKISFYLLRTAPSAGALYPVETYLAVNFAKDIQPGIYHLEIKDFSLALLREGYWGNLLSDLALGQKFFATASLVFIWSAVFRRTLSKYGERGLRYVFIDVGHICQNLLLAAEALNLKACPVGAFFDEELNKFLGLNSEEESVIYMATVGK